MELRWPVFHFSGKSLVSSGRHIHIFQEQSWRTLALTFQDSSQVPSLPECFPGSSDEVNLPQTYFELLTVLI